MRHSLGPGGRAGGGGRGGEAGEFLWEALFPGPALAKLQYASAIG